MCRLGPLELFQQPENPKYAAAGTALIEETAGHIGAISGARLTLPPPLELNLAGCPPPLVLDFPARSHRESNSNSISAASGNLPFISAHNSATAAAVRGRRGRVYGPIAALCRWMR